MNMIKKNCFNAFKLNLCSKSKKPKDDYEYVSYEKPVNPEIVVEEELSQVEITCNIDLDNEQVMTPKWQSTQIDLLNNSEIQVNYSYSSSSSSSTESEIQTFTTMNSFSSIRQMRQMCSKDKMIKESTKLLIKSGYYSSTDIDLTNDSIDGISNIQENETKNISPLTSTAVSDDSSSFSIESTTIDTQSLSSCSLSSSCDSIYATLDQTNSQDDSQSNISNIYVCSIGYKSRYNGDIDLNVLDKVEVIHEKDYGYVLVQLLTDGRFGYVPRACLVTIQQYLSQI